MTHVPRTSGPYRQALGHRDFRLLAAAQAQSSIAHWAYYVALTVYVYDATHSAGWVAAVTIGRMVPRFVASLYAGVVAERRERVRLMVTADVLRAVVMAAMAVATALHGAPALVIAMAGLNSALGSVYDPATAAMVPQLLGEDNVAAGNATTATITKLAVFVGPAVGALVLMLGNPSIVMALDALTFALSALLVSRMKARSTPTDILGAGGPMRQAMVGVRAITGSLSAAILVGFTVLTTALYGVDTVLFIFLSKDKLGTGATGYGYLIVALGIGGIIASCFVNRLAALPRLSVVLAVGMIAYAAPTALLVVVDSPSAAFGIEVVRGAATLVVDVLVITALQRSLAPELISRVFGVLWALALFGLAIGSLVTPFLLSGLGLDRTLLVAAFVVPVIVVLVYPRLAAIDRSASDRAAEFAPRMAVLEALRIFAAAPRPVIERLAIAATESVVEPGTVVISEGAQADALYVLVSGQVEVVSEGERSSGPQHIRFMEAPAYFGEIGLIKHIPRTATVRAIDESVLWRIEGSTFLAALNVGTPSQLLLQGMAGRLATTHPTQAAAFVET